MFKSIKKWTGKHQMKELLSIRFIRLDEFKMHSVYILRERLWIIYKNKFPAYQVEWHVHVEHIVHFRPKHPQFYQRDEQTLFWESLHRKWEKNKNEKNVVINPTLLYPVNSICVYLPQFLSQLVISHVCLILGLHCNPLLTHHEFNECATMVK